MPQKLIDASAYHSYNIQGVSRSRLATGDGS